jgi:uncharacterized protein with FMN-binding domain
VRKIVIAVMGTLSALVLTVSFDASRRGDVVTAADHEASDEQGAAADHKASDEQGAAADGAPPSSDDGAAPSPTFDDQGEPDDQDAPPPPPPSTSRGVSGTFLGDEVQTRWGVVQVRITVKNGRITKAKAVRYPDENHRDQEINSWAVPELQKMTVDNQGRVDSLSGATVTSDGYRESLQSALDKAHL